MSEITPRFEFRIFDPHLERIAEQIRSFAEFDRYRESREIYIISTHTDIHNTKIRNEVLDVKKLMKIEQELEQWAPLIKAEFPIDQKTISQKIIPILSADDMVADAKSYSLKAFIKDLIESNLQLQVAQVVKQRFGFQSQGCLIEAANVYINGSRTMTVCVESENPERVNQIRKRLGLEEEENVNYLRALKYTLGLHALPDGSVYNVLKDI